MKSGGPAQKVFRGMATLALGAGMARLLGIAAIPLLTRIYSPAEYGVLSVFTSLVLLLAPLLTLRYVVAIPLPRRDGTAMNVLALSLVVMLVATALVAIVLGCLGMPLLRLASMEELAPWWWLITLGVLGTALYEAMSMWATRRKAYRVIAQTQFVQSLVGESLKVLLGLLGFKPIGLLVGQVAAQSGGVGSFLSRFHQDFRRFAARVRPSRMWRVARYYRGFPVYRLPSQFLLVFSAQAPLMFSATLFGIETTGQIGLALMALNLPVNLIGQSMGQAFYAEISRLKADAAETIRQMAVAVQKRLFLVGLPIVALVFFLGQTLFKLVFGPEWTEAGHYASILSFSILLQFTSAPLVQILNVYNLQRYFLGINLMRSFALVALFLVAQRMGLGVVTFITLLSGILFCFYAAMTIFILRLVSRKAAEQRPAGGIARD